MKKLTLLVLASVSLLPLSTPGLANPNNPNDMLGTLSAPPIAASPTPILRPPQLQAKSYLLMDVNSEKILASKQIDEPLPPASLTKLMTLYLVFDALENQHLQLSDTVTVSTKAWRMKGSRMFIRAGDKVAVEDLLHGVITASGNDAAVALAEYIAGSEASFVALMNQVAQQLGMHHTHYTDSTGLPDPNHYTTARDMALLTRALILRFPKYYPYFKQKWFQYNGIKQSNRNRLLWHDASVDGLKTGHTDHAGFCLIASAKRNDMRLLSVVMGTPSDQARTNDSQQLLTWGFRFFETHQIYASQQPIRNIRVWGGHKKWVAMGTLQPLYVTVPRGQYKQIKTKLLLAGELHAPIKQYKEYGTIKLLLHEKIMTEKPIVALQNNPQGNMFRRLLDFIAHWWARLWGHTSA